MKYKQFDKIFGWVAFLIAAVVYLLTIEPTVSFWDCGEFISSSYKLEVGHPPGAPTFMLFGKIASLFASSPTGVAKMANGLSALASAATIMFLFWTIAYFARRIIAPNGEITRGKGIAIIGASMVGALAYTFSDTFWFSAVEGEVYASSSLFTAIVFWAILKWEQAKDSKTELRWILFIALMVGLSLGVHLLNLLAIPAMVLVIYFKKYNPNAKGLIVSLAISALVLLSIMYGVVPGVAKVAFQFELFFVNSLGLSYFSGVLVWVVLLIASLSASLYFTQFKSNKVIGTILFVVSFILMGIPFMSGTFLAIVIIAVTAYGAYRYYNKYAHILNTILLAFSFIIIGYSTFTLIVVRSLANPPMDQNNPDNVYSLLSYLNREQYGDRPLFYGEQYNSRIDKRNPYTKDKPIYHKKNGKYIVVGHKPKRNYKDNDLTLFPRMYSPDEHHVREYKEWAGIKGNRLPTFGQNIKFFVNYQMNWMYWRYFMWNFAGRQNDIQGHGNSTNGNWISGIPMFDKGRVGDLSEMPNHLKTKAHNKYYMLPLLLGLLGLVLQLRKRQRDWWVVLLLFILTGVAIVVYLNQTPLQPRERDYAYAGSFYAFSIWIGLGALAVYQLLNKAVKDSTVSAITASVICLVVPVQMAEQNWDDHDRSNRYVAQAFAHNYLNSCAPNAILFTYGDNDTFPIWYAQEVEGVRTDVKVCCLPYFASNWYIDQMKMETYEAAPMPLSLEPDDYEPQKRDIIYLYPDAKLRGYQNINKVVDFIKDEKRSNRKLQGNYYDTYPTTQIELPVNAENAVKAGIIKPKDVSLIEKEMTFNQAGDTIMLDKDIRFDFKQTALMKNQMMFLDLLANFDWKRPIYFTSIHSENTFKLDDYFRHDGFAYGLTPIKSSGETQFDTDLLYKNLMETFEFGNLKDPNVYIDHTIRRTTNVVQLRQTFTKLANQLIDEGKLEKAKKVMERCEEEVPITVIVPNYLYRDINFVNTWYRLGENERGDETLLKIISMYQSELKYYFSMKKANTKTLQRESYVAILTIQECYKIALRHKRNDVLEAASVVITEFEPKLTATFGMRIPE